MKFLKWLNQVTEANKNSHLTSVSIGPVFFAQFRIDNFLPDILSC